MAQGILDAPSPSPVPAAPRLPASLPPLKPSSCPAPRIQVRRIVSAPTVPSSDTSSPNTPLSAYNAADRNHKWDPPSTPDPLVR
ncbi:hypothetical protein VNI00_003191 [Paramarasmius palmivorus]|uniref:Uncharacterized protein n=1 Tax=Paramarasmius palmivorus TaxID=297713 RepID=A0AAW0DTC0_9AGAR